MGDGIPHKTSDFVKINISNSKTNAIAFERKFPKDLSIHEFKNKLEVVTGGCAGTMKLELYDGEKLLTKLDNDSAPLGFYPIEDGMRIHVIDNFLLLDSEVVEKFELTEQQYEEKTDTVKNFLKTNKLGKYNEEEMKQLEEKKRIAAEKEAAIIASATVGSRCQVNVAGQPRRIGTIMFNGTIDGKKGTVIGVKFDEPLGVNDGSVNGKKYFDCGPKYGSFVAPSAVIVGDFPPENDDLDDEI